MDSSLRGKCREFSERAAKEDPSLKVVKGWYYCPYWGEQAHWWNTKEDGTIVDLTKDQFPSKGNGEYVEFDGWTDCSECGKRVHESEVIVGGNGHYMFCSGNCYGRFVGVC
jgi:hypothetical protein